MKLYATTTSERATKGQGGNEYIDIFLKGIDGVELLNARLKYGHNDVYKKDLYELCYTKIHHNIIVSELITKGEKKKGECKHDLDNYGKCCNCGKYIVTE